MNKDLRLNLRIAVNNDGAPQALNQTTDGINRITAASGNASHNLSEMARDLVTMGQNASAGSQRLTAGMSAATSAAQTASRAIYDTTGSITAGMSSAASSTQIAAATIENSLRQASSSGRASMQSMTESMVVNLNAINATLTAMDARLVATGAETAGVMARSAAATNGNTSALLSLKSMIATLGLGVLAKDVLDTNREFESLRMQLNGVMGSAAAGGMAFQESMRWAVKTPFELKDITQAFITLKNFGINPTNATMEAITNQASRLGKGAQGLTTLTTQLGQAWTKGSLQMQDMHIIMEAGVPVIDMLKTITGKTGAEIAKMSDSGELGRESIKALIDEMGRLTAGSNEAAMKTLNGQISNLSDAWHNFEDTLLGDKSEGLIKNIVASITNSVNLVTRNMSDSIDAQIAHSQARIKTLSSMGSVGAFVSDMTGYDANLEKNKLDALQRAKVVQDEANQEIVINQNRANAIKETNDWLADITNEDAAASAKAAKKAAKDSVDEAKKQASEAASAAKSLQTAYENAVNSMEQTLIKNTDQTKSAAMEYEVMTGSLKNLTEAKKLHLLQLSAEIDNQALKKKADDAEKSAMDSLIDNYKKLTLSARDYYAATLTKQGVSTDKQAPLMQQYDKNTSIESSQKSINDTRSALENYNKSLADTLARTSDLGATNTALFDSSLGGINAMSGAFDNMIKSISANTKALNDLHQMKMANDKLERDTNNLTQDQIKKNNGEYLIKLKEISDNKKTYALEEQYLNIENLKDSLTGIRQTASAMGSMFAENTAARKAFNIVSLAASISERLADIAQLEVKAALAVLTQGQGDPYTAFARIAAMGAIVASILSAANAGTFRFGGNASSPGPQGMAPDTGTVLGDSTAKSQSIDKTYQLLKDIQSENYPILKSIDKGIADLHSGITDVITRLYQAGGLTAVNAPASGYAPSLSPIANSTLAALQFANLPTAMLGMKLDPISNFLMNGIFGGKQESTVIGQGISTNPTSLSDIIAGKNLSAQQFAQIETKTSGGWFGSDKFSTSMQYAALDDQTQKALNSVFKSMGQTMQGLADSLGMGLSDRVKNYIIPGLAVDLKGLNGEDAAKKLNGVLSTALDTMSSAVFGDILGQYQQLGEGMLETAVRVVAEIAVVKDALSASRISFTGDIIKLSDDLSKAAGGITEFQKSFDNFYTHFFSAADQQTQLTAQLSSQLNGVNMALPATRDGYKNLISALDLNNSADQDRFTLLLKLSSAADTYYKNIEQLTQNRRALEISYYSASGRAVDALNTQRADEIAALKLTGDAIAVNYQQMIYAAQDLASAQKAAADAANTGLDAAMKKLTASVDAQKTVLSDKYKADSDALKAQLDATLKANATQKQSASDLLNSLTSTAQKIRSALSSTVVDTAELTRQRRLSAQSVLQSALDLAKSGGSLANYAGLDQALTDIAKPSQDLFATFQDFQRDQGRTAAVISDLADHADTQVSVAQLTLNAIDSAATAAQAQYDAQYKVLTDTYNAETSQLDGILSSAQTQIDLLRGIDNSILTLAQALLGVDASKSVAAQTTASVAPTFAFTVHEGATAGGYQSSGGAFYDASTRLINSKTGGIYTIAAAQQWVKDTLAAGNPALVRATAIAEGISAQSLDALMGDSPGTWNAWALANKLPAFAAGGDHLGGLRIVGENGPELENTGPSRIFNAQQTRDILSGNDNNAALTAVIEKLTATVAKLEARLEQIEKNTRDTEKNTKESSTVLGKVTLGGTSVRTTPA